MHYIEANVLNNNHKLQKSVFFLLALFLLQTSVSFADMNSEDHVFGYVKTFGSLSDINKFTDIINDVETDSNGNVYQSGAFRFTIDFNPEKERNIQRSGYYNDAYVSKTNADGSFAWVWRTEGYYGAYATSAIADDQGNVYVTGYFNGKTDFDSDRYSTEYKYSRYSWDAFYAKLDKDGVLIWVKTLNGNRDEFAQDIAIDKDGNLYITGYYNATILDFDPGFYTVDWQGILGYPTLFVTKINNDGTYGWTHRSGHTAGNIQGHKIEISTQPEGSSDLIYIAGHFSGTINFDENDRNSDTDLQTTVSNGSSDGFLFQLNDQGNFNWLRTIGSISTDQISDIHTTNTGVYVIGTTIDETAFGDELTEEPLGTPGGRNVYYSQFNADGSYIQTKILPSTSASTRLFIATDNNNNVYVSGIFSQTTDFYSGSDPLASDIREIDGYSNVYVSKYLPNGNSIWTKTIAIDGNEALSGMSLADNGNLYLTGNYSNTVDFDPSSENEFSKTASGYQDIYLLLLTPSPEEFPESTDNTDSGIPDSQTNLEVSNPNLTPGSIQPGLSFFFLRAHP